MIQLKNYSISFDDKQIIKKTNLTIDAPLTIIGGKNGTGKTTLLNSIYGLNRFEGEIIVDDLQVSSENFTTLRREYINYVTQDVMLLDTLSVIDNLKLFHNNLDEDKLTNYLKYLNLETDILSSLVQDCSGGEKQKILLINALLSSSKYLFLDEIDNNVDRKTMANIIELLTKEKRNMIVISHSISEKLIYSFEPTQIQVLQISNNTINTRKESETKSTQFPLVNNPITLTKKNTKSISHTMRKNNKLTFIVLFIALALISLITTNSLTNYDFGHSTYSGLVDDDVLIVDIPVNTFWFPEYGDESWLDVTPYYFTDENMEALEQLPYVEKVIPIHSTRWDVSTGGYPVGDEIYSLVQDQFTLDEVDIEKYGYSFDQSGNSKKFDVTFNHQLYPNEVAEQIGFVPVTQLNYLYGDAPKENSKEIAIDTYYAAVLADQYNLSSFDELIDMEVELSLQNPRRDKQTTISLIVSGITEPRAYSSYAAEGSTGINLLSNIYIPYNTDSSVVTDNQPWLIDDYDRLFANMQSEYDKLGISLEGVDPTSIGKYPSFYIKLTDSKYQEDIFNLLTNYDNHLYINSNYSMDHTDYYSFYGSRMNKLLLMLAITFIISILLIRTISKNYISELEKTNDILSFYGYEKSMIYKIINKKINMIVVILSLISIGVSIWFSIILADPFYLLEMIPGLLLLIIFKLTIRKGLR